MRVLALATDAYGGQGGIAQSNRDLFSSLSEAGCEVVILPRRGRAAGPLPHGVQQLAPSAGRMSYSIRAAGQGKGRYGLIFCGHLYMAPLASWLSRSWKVPFWLHLHGIEAWRRPSAAAARAAEKATLVTAVSRFTRRQFLSWADMAPEKVRVLPNTVGREFSPGPKPQKLAAKLGLTGKTVLLTVGRISSQERYKGHDRVLAALPEILRSYREAVYVVAGEGDDRHRLETLARALGVDASVRFIGSPPAEEMPELYRLADVFVMPSSGEGFGIVFLEALSSGLPVIGESSGGSTDPLQDGLLGTLADPRSASLAPAILSVLRGERRQASASHPFTRENIQNHLHRLLQPFLHQ